jgi:S-adenosylmethionine synthetase
VNPHIRMAEYVLPGHPDKLADRIADGLVDLACARDTDALVGVEVALHRDTVFVDGRIAAAGEPITMAEVEGVVRDAYRDAGYDGDWCPDPDALRVTTDLCIETLSADERLIRGIADDQNIVTGYATGDESTNWLPLEHYLAWRLARRLHSLRAERPDLPLGPDGKLLVVLEEHADHAVPLAVSVSLHHGEMVDWVALTRATREAVLGELGRAAATIGSLRLDDRTLRIELNGAGSFAVGGPYGDNGLSGKKLVVDAYGPRVPIGGGAMSGKDPHKIDRAGALRARQIAKAVVQTGLVREALVRMAFLPGDRAPSFVEITADGRVLDATVTRRWTDQFDLTLEGTFRELGLADVCWRDTAVWGAFSLAVAPPGQDWCAATIRDPGAQ